MSLRLAALPLVLVGLLPLTPAWAEDPTATASPAAAYKAKVASLPAPSAEHGFRLDGILRVNGKVFGHATLMAAPAGEKGDRWRVGDQIVIKASAQPRIELAEAIFSQSLVPLEGIVRSNKPGDAAVRWARTDTGYRGTTVEKQGEVSTEKVRNFEHKETALTTLSATILFARFALDAPGTYATFIFEAENGMKGETAMNPVTLQVHGERELDGKKVLYVTGQKGEQKLELLFKPEGKEIVGVRFEEGPQRVEVLKADMWSAPSRDPVTAALRAALAFGTGDVDLLDSLIYWPRFYRAVMETHKQPEGQEPPKMDSLRESIIAQWRKTLPKNPVEMIKPVLPQIRPQLKTRKLEGGDVEVLFPEVFRSLKLRLGQAYGFWHLVALPGVGKQPAPVPAKPDAEPKKDG
ncbi:MAG: hypothetical protein QNJ90_00560 [Planctomycetota bacterium]|nr:hypothetical protein [Planctomycetota bacterium]